MIIIQPMQNDMIAIWAPAIFIVMTDFLFPYIDSLPLVLVSSVCLLTFHIYLSSSHFYILWFPTGNPADQARHQNEV